MSLIIRENKSTIHPKQGMSANYLVVQVNNKKPIILPQISASRTDYDKAERAKIPLNAKIFQYYINLKLSIYKDIFQKKILGDYKSIMKLTSNLVSF